MSIFFHNATHNLLFTFMQKVHLQALFLLTAMAATGCSDWERMSSNPSTVCLQGRIPGKGDLSPAWTLTCWGRQVSPVSPWTRESCSPACASCLPFHCIPAFACTSVPALLPWSWQCARVQPIWGAVCALCCDNLTSPQGTSCFCPRVCVCVSASAASSDFIPVSHRWPEGNVTFIPRNSVILHSRVLLMGNLNEIQGAFKWDFTTIKWNFVPKITQFLLSNFSPLESSGKDRGNTPSRQFCVLQWDFSSTPISLCAPLAAFGTQLFGQWKLWGWIQSGEQYKLKWSFPIWWDSAALQ